MPKLNDLSPKERIFVDEWLIDKNGARAARAAGYAPRSATAEAHKMLQKPHIRKAVQKALDAQQKRTLMTADAVLHKIERITEKAEGDREYGAALRGLELIGKHFKLFTEKHEHGGIGGGPIQMHLTPEDEAL